mgnify:CR=1 FL=1
MITKQQAMSTLTPEEEAEVKRWETRIDQALAKHDVSTTVEWSGSNRVRERVMEIYRVGNWKVAYYANGREAPTLVFS